MVNILLLEKKHTQPPQQQQRHKQKQGPAPGLEIKDPDRVSRK